jgi:ribosomal protein S18 acetylase RimI-like enzyme
MIYKFFAKLDKETKIWFDMNACLPSSLINYMRLFLSTIIPRHILLTALPKLALITVTYKLDHTVQAFGYLSIRRSFVKCYESELGIVVGKKLRRKGIGNMLVEALTDQAKRANVIKIVVNVSAKNIPAINLFRKNGFSIVSRKDSKTGHTSRYIMELYLNSQSKRYLSAAE